jgi:hypothetical protein
LQPTSYDNPHRESRAPIRLTASQADAVRYANSGITAAFEFTTSRATPCRAFDRRCEKPAANHRQFREKFNLSNSRAAHHLVGFSALSIPDPLAWR